jgi:hypothetical protein
MTTVKTTETVLFHLKEAAAILDFTDGANALRDLVRRAGLEVAHPGTSGKGRAYRFTIPEMYGLCCACGQYIDGKRRCVRRQFFRDEYDRYASWPLPAVEHAIGLNRDDWSAEAFAKQVSPSPLTEEEREWLKVPPHPEDVRAVHRIVYLVCRLRAAVKERLEGKPERMKERTGKRT